MSENPKSPAPKKEMIAPHHESLAEEFADDPPVSALSYGEARLWLVARDPHSLFSYWNFCQAEHPEATGADGRTHFSLRIYREDGEIVSTIEIPAGIGHTFITAREPDCGYFAELGFLEEDIWCFLVRSGNARTPPELPGTEKPATFVTIPADISIGKMTDALAHVALPDESLAATAARIQEDARLHRDWTPEHERLLAEILGESTASAVAPSANSLPLTRRIQQKLADAAKAAAPYAPIPAPGVSAGGEGASSDTAGRLAGGQSSSQA